MKTIVLLIALFFTVTSFSQPLSFPDSCNTIMWGVVNSKGDTSYLLGTCHIFGNTFVDGYAPINSKYRQADVVVVESIDNNFLAQKNNWFKKLPAKDHRLIKNYLQHPTPLFHLTACTKMPPSWFYYLLLLEMASRECHTYNENDVCDMDQYIMNGAITFNKKLCGLEQRDDSFNNALFSHAGVRNDEDAIAKIKDFVVNNNLYKDTVHNWCELNEINNYRNLTINYKFSKSSIEEDSSSMITLDQRNDRWMPGVKAIIDSSKAFIAVGLGHLYYKKGLIVQLANSGYTLFPVAMHNTGPVTYANKKKRRS